MVLSITSTITSLAYSPFSYFSSSPKQNPIQVKPSAEKKEIAERSATHKNNFYKLCEAAQDVNDAMNYMADTIKDEKIQHIFEDRKNELKEIGSHSYASQGIKRAKEQETMKKSLTNLEETSLELNEVLDESFNRFSQEVDDLTKRIHATIYEDKYKLRPIKQDKIEKPQMQQETAKQNSFLNRVWGAVKPHLTFENAIIVAGSAIAIGSLAYLMTQQPQGSFDERCLREGGWIFSLDNTKQCVIPTPI